MNDDQMDQILLETLEDRRLSRAERKALRSVVADEALDKRALERFRRRAFAAADDACKGGRPTGDVLEWLEDTLRALIPKGGDELRADSHFSPGEDCLRSILACVRSAQRHIDVCVFTVTDDRISDELGQAHRRGVKVRMISDDDKSGDLGSDMSRLERLGIDARFDSSPSHMHHKFALFDRTTLLTGSYNWTRSAQRANQENILVTDEPRLVRDFQRCFEGLWAAFEE